MNNENIEFKWTEELSVGDEAIDVQHKTLLHNVNKLSSAISDSRGEAAVNDVIDFLEDYIKEHFSYEEDYMLAYEYPAYREHKAMHDTFIEKYKEFKLRIAESNPSPELVLEVQEFVGNWFLTHISIEDQKYEEYINSK